MAFLPKQGDPLRNPAFQGQKTDTNQNSLGYNQNKVAPFVNQNQKGLNPTLFKHEQLQNHQTQNRFSPPHMSPIKHHHQRENSIPNKFIELNEQKPSLGDNSDVYDPDNEEGNIIEDYEVDTGKIIRSNKITAPPFLPQYNIHQMSQSQISSKEMNASQGILDSKINVPLQNMNNINQLEGNMDEAMSEKFYSCNGDDNMFYQRNSAHPNLHMSYPEQISHQNSHIAQQAKMNASRIDSQRPFQDNNILFYNEDSSYSQIGLNNSQAQNDLRYTISQQRREQSSYLIDFDKNSNQDKYYPQESQLQEQYIQSNQNSRIIAMEQKAEQVSKQIDERVKNYNFDQMEERISNIYEAVVTQESVKQIENYLSNLKSRVIKEIYETRKLNGMIQQLEKNFLGQIEMSEGEEFINENNMKCYWIPKKLKQSKESDLNRKLQDSILQGDFVVNEIKLQCSFLEYIRTSTYSTLAKLLDRSTPAASEKKVTIKQFNSKIQYQLHSFIRQGIEELEKSENIKKLKLEAENKLEKIKTIKVNFEILNAAINKDVIDEFEKLKALIIFKKTTDFCEEFEALFKESTSKQTSTFSNCLEQIFKVFKESQKQYQIKQFSEKLSDFEKEIQIQYHSLFKVLPESIQKTAQMNNKYLRNFDNYLLEYHLCSFDQTLYYEFLSEDSNRIIIEYYQTNYKKNKQELYSIYYFLENQTILKWFILTLSQIFQKDGFYISSNPDKEAYNKIDEELFILFNLVLNNMIDQYRNLEKNYHIANQNSIINQFINLPTIFGYGVKFLPKQNLDSEQSDKKQNIIFYLDQKCNLIEIMIPIPNFPVNITVGTPQQAEFKNSIISLANQNQIDRAYCFALYIFRLQSIEKSSEKYLSRFLEEYKENYSLVTYILSAFNKNNLTLNTRQILICNDEEFALMKQQIIYDKRAWVIRIMNKHTKQADRIIFYENYELKMLLLFPNSTEISKISDGSKYKEYKKIRILYTEKQNLLRIIFFDFMENQNFFTLFLMQGLFDVIDHTFSISQTDKKQLSKGLISDWIEKSAKYYQKQIKEQYRMVQ